MQSNTPMTEDEVLKAVKLNAAIECAAKSLLDGDIISIEIEHEGYGVYLKRGFSKTSLDGGDGMISDIYKGIEKSHEDCRAE
jgi:hypothetical protein